MTVSIDCHSATRLIAEGAICFDVDHDNAECDGLPVRLPSSAELPEDRSRPILVCGDVEQTVLAVTELLAQRGLPAWRVVHDCGISGAACCHRSGAPDSSMVEGRRTRVGC